MRIALTLAGLVAIAGTLFAQSKQETKPADKKNVEIELRLDTKGGGDKHLAELEAKLQALLKEIHTLRGTKPVPPKPPVPPTPPTAPAIKALIESKIAGLKVQPATPGGAAREVIVTVTPDGKKVVEGKHVMVLEKAHVGEALKSGATKQVIVSDNMANPSIRYSVAVAGGAGDVLSLTRATYNLPAAGAKALNDFLSTQVKAKVLEIKAEGDKLTVTTTPDVQHTIGGIVALMQGKSPAMHGTQLYWAPGAAKPASATGQFLFKEVKPATTEKSGKVEKKPAETPKPSK